MVLDGQIGVLKKPSRASSVIRIDSSDVQLAEMTYAVRRWFTWRSHAMAAMFIARVTQLDDHRLSPPTIHQSPSGLGTSQPKRHNRGSSDAELRTRTRSS